MTEAPIPRAVQGKDVPATPPGPERRQPSALHLPPADRAVREDTRRAGARVGKFGPDWHADITEPPPALPPVETKIPADSVPQPNERPMTVEEKYAETKFIFRDFKPSEEAGRERGGVILEDKKPQITDSTVVRVEMSFSKSQKEIIDDVTTSLTKIAKGKTLDNKDENAQPGKDFATRMFEELPPDGLPTKDEVCAAFTNAAASLITDLVEARPELTPAIQAMFRQAGIEGLGVVEVDTMNYYLDRQKGKEPHRVRQPKFDFVATHPFAKAFPTYEVHCPAPGLARTLTGYAVSVIDDLFDPENTRRTQIANRPNFTPGPLNFVDQLPIHINQLVGKVEQRFTTT